LFHLCGQIIECKNAVSPNQGINLFMSPPHSNDPLHGIALEQIVNHLAGYYGWDELGKRITIRCFNSNPSVKSSLKFLRKTPWARKKVEDLYIAMQREIKNDKA
jgi:uncharacterized protein (DUF2132 family)